jgi:serine protease Do
MQVGDQVVAIGNALGELSSSLTVGYVSGVDRDITTDGTVINMIQTDAAINSGNSCGPLFNAKGEVIGITTAKYSGTTSSGASIEGISFAIPLDDVIDMIEDLRDYGYIKSAYLGVMVWEVDATVADTYNLPQGVYVEEVTAGACADRAGVHAKDIIVELGGYTVRSMNDLSRALRAYEAGETVTIVVWRAGQQVILKVTLDEKPIQ